MTIEGIPEGWELVRVGGIKRGEFFIGTQGQPAESERFANGEATSEELADAAAAAAWAAQEDWLRKNTKPNFEVTE